MKFIAMPRYQMRKNALKKLIKENAYNFRGGYLKLDTGQEKFFHCTENSDCTWKDMIRRKKLMYMRGKITVIPVLCF